MHKTSKSLRDVLNLCAGWEAKQLLVSRQKVFKWRGNQSHRRATAVVRFYSSSTFCYIKIGRLCYDMDVSVTLEISPIIYLNPWIILFWIPWWLPMFKMKGMQFLTCLLYLLEALTTQFLQTMKFITIRKGMFR